MTWAKELGVPLIGVDLAGCFWAGLIERISSNQRRPACLEIGG
jgi:hypothetical protein